jgi:hypothetical protein
VALFCFSVSNFPTPPNPRKIFVYGVDANPQFLVDVQYVSMDKYLFVQRGALLFVLVCQIPFSYATSMLATKQYTIVGSIDGKKTVRLRVFVIV